MALTWQPDPGSLQQIMHLLKESQSPDTKTQQELKPVRHPLTPLCACVSVGRVSSETGSSKSVPRLQQLPGLCLH